MTKEYIFSELLHLFLGSSFLSFFFFNLPSRWPLRLSIHSHHRCADFAGFTGATALISNSTIAYSRSGNNRWKWKSSRVLCWVNGIMIKMFPYSITDFPFETSNPYFFSHKQSLFFFGVDCLIELVANLSYWLVWWGFPFRCTVLAYHGPFGALL